MHEHAQRAQVELCIAHAEQIQVVDKEVHLAARRPHPQAAAAGYYRRDGLVLHPAGLAAQAAAQVAVHLGAPIAAQRKTVMVPIHIADQQPVFILPAAQTGAGGELCIKILEHGRGSPAEQITVPGIQAQ